MIRTLRRPLAVMAAMLIAAMWFASAAQAQTACGKRADMVDKLDKKYGETRHAMGLADGAGVVELYANEETGSWTILITSPQGIACMMAVGRAFQIDRDVVPPTGNPA